MAGLDKSNYRKEQNSYYNINIYNDTNLPITAQYNTSLSMPLLHKPSECEIAVARASVPLDGIPISQRNIGFEEWAVQFTNVSQNIIESGFVGQFNPDILYDNQFNLALTNQPLTDALLTNAQQTGTSVISQVPSVNVLTTNLIANSNVPNIAYGQTFICHYDSTTINRYQYGNNTLFDTVDIQVISGIALSEIVGVCVSSDNDVAYAICINTVNTSYFVIDIYNNAMAPIYLPNYGGSVLFMNSFTCNDTYITAGYTELFGINSRYITLFDSTPLQVNTTLNYGPLVNNILTYLDNTTQDKFYLNFDALNGFARRNLPNFITNLNFTCPANHTFSRFLGSDQLDNILVDLLNTNTNFHSIYAYNKTTAAIVYNITTTETDILLGTSTFINAVSPLPSPSTTPFYEIWNYQEYLDQINLGIQTVFNTIKTSTGWVSQVCPYISYSGSKFSLNIDKAFVSGGNAIISFNDRLWQRFMLNSSTNVLDDSFEDLQILDLIPNQTATDLLQIIQPFSTSYRWFDITRVIIGSSKLSIAGDCELSDTSLLSITDFSVDTSSDTVLLQIYNPIVIRFYQMFGTTPLTMINVHFSYATRDGNIYPIYITPGSSCSTKLLFKRTLLQLSF